MAKKIIALNLEDLGYSAELEEYRLGQKLEGYGTGRVTAEHKERYIIAGTGGELEAEISGNMRFTATSREDFPAVGDWVAFTPFENDFAIIHRIYPRSSLLARQAAGQKGEKQVIAANIDYALLVQAIDRDVNPNRLERYLALCHSSGVNPVIILTKTDLVTAQDREEITKDLNARIPAVPVIALSNETRTGYEALASMIEKGRTYCLLGSSGAGKSTLLNNLSGRAIMPTGSISSSTNKGRHVTTRRELVILENGGIIIDNPGMREVGMADATAGLETAFDALTSLSGSCRFKDCTHTAETGCAIIRAVENGEIDREAYENYLKLRREDEHFAATVAARRKKEKQFGKMMKHYKKDMKKNNH